MPRSCTTIEADIYGIIPSAKTDAWEKAPPENISSNPIIPEDVWLCKFASWEGSIPGREIYFPSLYRRIIPSVYSNLARRSSIFQIFFKVLISLMELQFYNGSVFGFNCCSS